MKKANACPVSDALAFFVSEMGFDVFVKVKPIGAVPNGGTEKITDSNDGPAVQ